ncbi:hypothetical protein [Bartonella phoceensis]|nr:hypothetical protein [Bartonella phoceensis]
MHTQRTAQATQNGVSFNRYISFKLLTFSRLLFSSYA